MTKGAKAKKKLRSSPKKSVPRKRASEATDASTASRATDATDAVDASGTNGARGAHAERSAVVATARAAPGVSTTDPGTAEELDATEAIEVDISSFDEDESEARVAPLSSSQASSPSRRSERVNLEERVEIRGAFGSQGHTVRDASLHGVFVETAFLLEVGDPVALTFPLEGGGRLKVSGRVRWVTPFGGLKDARPGMGIELVSLDAGTRETLSALLYRKAHSGSVSGS